MKWKNLERIEKHTLKCLLHDALCALQFISLKKKSEIKEKNKHMTTRPSVALAALSGVL